MLHVYDDQARINRRDQTPFIFNLINKIKYLFIKTKNLLNTLAAA